MYVLLYTERKLRSNSTSSVLLRPWGSVGGGVEGVGGGRGGRRVVLGGGILGGRDKYQLRVYNLNMHVLH